MDNTWNEIVALDYVSGDYVIFMNDDGQYPAFGIERIVNKFYEGFDVVYAIFPAKKENFIEDVVVGWMS